MAAPATLGPAGRLPEPAPPDAPQRPAPALDAVAETRRSPHPRWAYGLIALAALLLAALSLLLAAAPSYDPWAWIVWGRELVHLDLLTTGGPSWKPLPVLITALLSPFGAAAPDLWLVLARACGLAGVAAACGLAFRLGRAGTGSRSAGVVAAALAVAGLALLSGFLDSVAAGESEGLLVALLALAALRHLDEHPRQAFVLGFAAALIRPETWPGLALYATHLWRRDAAARRLIVALLVLVPALWFLPELWGGGSMLRGVSWARHPRPGSPALAACPFCAELAAHAWPLVLTPFKLGVAFALGIAAAGRRGRPLGRLTAVEVLVALALGWIVEEALLTQAGFSGSDRYLLAPAAILIVAGAAGWARALGSAWPLRRARVRMRAPAALGLLVALLLAAAVWHGGHPASFATTLARQRAGAGLLGDVRAALRRAGGTRALLACGSVQTNPSASPLVAWALGVHMLWVENDHGDVVIQSRSDGSAQRLPALGRRSGYRLAARAGGVRIFERCR